MPTRRRTRNFSRRPRRRTRWLAIVPSARVISTNNAYASDGIGLQVAGPLTKPWADLTGHTILRTIIDFDYDPDIVYTNATSVGSMIVHQGLFMSADDAPPVAIWSPNVPSGDFMYRDTYSAWTRREASTEGWSTQFMGRPDNGRHMHWDIPVRRKVRENDQMWLSWYSFKAASNVYNSVAIGWTGRILVALP